MQQTKVFVVGGECFEGYARPIYNKMLVQHIEEADIVLFPGGADICPETYNRQNVCSFGSWRRDKMEIQMYDSVRKDQLIMGTCRGAQLLTVMNGGNLVQDVEGHASGYMHGVVDNDGKEYEVTSIHHQMCYPFEMPKVNYTILMKSSPARSVGHYIGDGIDVNKIECEPELIVFHNTAEPYGIGIQGHPEMMSMDSPIVKELNVLLDKYVKLAKQRV